MKKSGIIDEKLKLDHGNLLKKYENYALTNLNFGIDRVRYNVKGVFDKVIELYNVMKLDKNLHQLIQTVLGAKYLVFVSSPSVKMREFSFLIFFIPFDETLFIFQFLNDKMHKYVKQNIIVNFIIEK